MPSCVSKEEFEVTAINQAKIAVGIDPCRDIVSPSCAEVETARVIFAAALAQYAHGTDMSTDAIVTNAIAEVWHAAKQYYAQHPKELHRVKCF